jgi:hypothetical protein
VGAAGGRGDLHFLIISFSDFQTFAFYMYKGILNPDYISGEDI